MQVRLIVSRWLHGCEYACLSLTVCKFRKYLLYDKHGWAVFCVPGHVFCHDFCGLGQGSVCDVVGAWGEICEFAQICTLKMAKMGTLCTHESKMRAFFQKKVSKVLWFNKIALILPPVRVFLPKRVSESAVRQQRCGLCGSTRTSTHIYVI